MPTEVRMRVDNVVDDYLQQGDHAKENSNMSWGPNGMLFAIGDEGLRRDNLARMKEAGHNALAAMHEAGAVHIHDLGLGFPVPYCFPADERVKLADGTTPTMAELSQLEEFEVLCMNDKRQLTTGTGHNVRVTRKDAELVRVNLDSGKSFRCTPDHKIMLRDGTWCEAKNLTPGLSLMPCYLHNMPNGYVMYERWSLSEGRRVKKYLHRHLVEVVVGRELLSSESVYHKNGVKKDNRPANLQLMLDKDHRAKEIRRTHKSEKWRNNTATMLEERNKSAECREIVSKFAQERERDASGCFNHKVVSVESCTEREDVYCMEVKEHHNFLLATGVFAHNCSGWSLSGLLSEGIKAGMISSKPAKHFRAAINHIVNFIGAASNEFAGAQAFNDVDLLLAPHAYKAYLDLRMIGCSEALAYQLARRDVYQGIQELLFHLNYNNRWGGQTPFSNITLSITCPSDMKDSLAMVAGQPLHTYYNKLEHGFALEPVTYGMLGDWQQLIVDAILDGFLHGDANGRGFTFPVLTINVTPEFFNHPARHKIFELTAKYGTPFFQNFINGVSGGHRINPEDVRSMCCRLQLDKEEIRKHVGGLFGNGDQTGSIQVVTVSLPYLAAICCERFMDKIDKSQLTDTFFSHLTGVMEYIRDEQLWKRQVVEEYYDKGFFPMAKANLKRGFSTYFTTIGFIGLWECVEILTGNEMSFVDNKGMELAQEIMNHMAATVARFTDETGKLFNLEATPAESAAYKLAKKALKRFPSIHVRGLKKAPYFTNSCHIPVELQHDLHLTFKTQAKLQTIPSGGTVTHFYTAEEMNAGDVEAAVRTICDTPIPYFSITTIFSVCPICGRIPGQHEFCPNSHTEEQLKAAGLL